MKDLSLHEVTTTNGDKFTGKQHAKLANLIYKRFGCDMASAHAAWKRLLQNNCSEVSFAFLVSADES